MTEPDDEEVVSTAFRSSFPSIEDEGFRTRVCAESPLSGLCLPLHKTMLHALAMAAQVGAERGISFVPDDEDGVEERLTFTELYARVKRLAAALHDEGLRAGERVLIVLPTSPAFVIAFFAVQRLGAIPVPSYPPALLEKAELALERLHHVASHAGATLCLTTGALRPLLGELAVGVKGLRDIRVVEKLLARASTKSRKARVEPGDPAFIQYTSGSTGDPKGVLLTHENLTHNVHAIGLATRFSKKDVIVSWLPLYHDMGLIGVVLTAIYWRMHLVLLSPTTFLMRPGRWLWAIHRHRGTVSVAPNFAYGLCVKRVRPSEREGLDLSSLRVLLNGAEPVSLSTMTEFEAAFAPHGLAPSTFLPVYGLAEVSVAVTFSAPGAPLISESLDRRKLAAGHVVPAEGEGAVTLVSSGQAIRGHAIDIVDADGRALADRRVGHLVVRGPSVMAGYYRSPEATAKVLREGWLWTGDLGYRSGGNLFITGRAKDLLIVRGKNHYAEDIERELERVEGVRAGGTVAFSLFDASKHTELAVVVCETKLTGDAERAALAEQVMERVSERCGLSLEEVVLVPAGTIPRTSSGKRQRALTRERYLADALTPERTSKLKLALVFARSGMGLLSLLPRRLLGDRRPTD
jgi:acyl-CoA synthetase (AMP-forming)/AMP-acid ligase II